MYEGELQKWVWPKKKKKEKFFMLGSKLSKIIRVKEFTFRRISFASTINNAYVLWAPRYIWEAGLAVR